MTPNPEVLVVGGGPAGLAAAAAASAAGADVLLIDENSQLGGNLRYRVQPVAPVDGEPPMPPAELREALIAGATDAGATLRPGVIAAGWYAGGKVLLVEGDAARVVTPERLIVASGSTDLPFPFAGATLPGVVTARAMQILLNTWRVRPGEQFAVIGSSAEASEVVIDIALAGGEVVFNGVAPAPLLKANGASGVQEFWIGDERYDVQSVVIAMGRQPDAALATMAGAELGFAPRLGGLIPRTTDLMQAAERVFVAGDAAGVGSVAEAIAEGRIAGKGAAMSLGTVGAEEVMAAVAQGGEMFQRRAEARRDVQPVYSQPYL